MKRFPFKQANNKDYDERYFKIDDKICALLKQRKEIELKDASIPSEEVFGQWAKKYGLYEDYLKALFSTIEMEDFYKPKVEPAEFRKHLQVFKAYEKEEVMYTVTFIRQYSNASVIYLHTDWEGSEDSIYERENHHRSFELFIDDSFDCRSNGGGGGSGYMRHTFIVSPPLPDNPSGMELVFTETFLFKENRDEHQFVIKLD